MFSLQLEEFALYPWMTFEGVDALADLMLAPVRLSVSALKKVNLFTSDAGAFNYH